MGIIKKKVMKFEVIEKKVMKFGVIEKKVMKFGVFAEFQRVCYIYSLFLAKHRVTSEYLVAKINVDAAENDL